jgi:hypothetical protein
VQPEVRSQNGRPQVAQRFTRRQPPTVTSSASPAAAAASSPADARGVT